MYSFMKGILKQQMMDNMIAVTLALIEYGISYSLKMLDSMYFTTVDEDGGSTHEYLKRQ